MGLSFLNKKPSPESVATEVRTAIAEAAEDDKILDRPPESIPYEDLNKLVQDEHESTAPKHKLSQLVDDDFPFDESQLAAIEGMASSPYACMTGAAGTGKTTSTKKFVDRLMDSTAIGAVDMREYWGKRSDDDHESYDDGDDYEQVEDVIPAVAIVTFTGRASQQVKGNFPRDWHGNIMTIHRCLGFYPEPYEDWDPERVDPETGEKGAFVTKRRFVPTYTADFKLPWDVIIIDEAGMLGLDLWHQLWAACKKGCRIYMIGDINQLPPVHGKSVFGFALARWPAFELTHVHRQQGKDNPIVDNAWRIIHGKMPVSGGRFQMIKMDGDAQLVSRKLRAMLPALQQKGIYDPIRDSVITPINGEDGARGYALGQLPLNREFALMFNSNNENPRYIIDGGRVKQRFAVGDKVMATKNDWEAGITNGMTGVITSIAEHGGYSGDKDRYGTIEEVSRNMQSLDSGTFDHEIIDLDALESTFEGVAEGNKAKKEKRERGPASHIVTVRFGTGEHAFEIPFATLAEVESLMTAYAVTCHKMQGGEAPTIIIICHDAHRAMLYREWLYTAVTRASQMCILIFTETALKVALNKQNIKGRSLKEKIISFNELMNPRGSFESSSKLVELPECDSQGLAIMDREERIVSTPARLMSESEKSGGLATLVQKAQEKTKESVKESAPIHKEVHIHVHVTEAEKPVADSPRGQPAAPIDGGTLHPAQSSNPHPERVALPAPLTPVSQVGAARAWMRIQRLADQPLRLTHQPVAKPEPAKPSTKPGSGLAFLKSKSKG